MVPNEQSYHLAGCQGESTGHNVYQSSPTKEYNHHGLLNETRRLAHTQDISAP